MYVQITFRSWKYVPKWTTRLTGFYFPCFGVTYLILINYGRDISSSICPKHLYEVDEALEFKVVDKKLFRIPSCKYSV